MFAKLRRLCSRNSPQKPRIGKTALPSSFIEGLILRKTFRREQTAVRPGILPDDGRAKPDPEDRIGYLVKELLLAGWLCGPRFSGRQFEQRCPSPEAALAPGGLLLGGRAAHSGLDGSNHLGRHSIEVPTVVPGRAAEPESDPDEQF